MRNRFCIQLPDPTARDGACCRQPTLHSQGAAGTPGFLRPRLLHLTACCILPSKTIFPFKFCSITSLIRHNLFLAITFLLFFSEKVLLLYFFGQVMYLSA